jgi:hypothetical protein
MTPDIFSLDASELNGFVFADIATELNGSTLTVLSTLSRLGEDPWALAAAWARLPRATASECLADRIAQMPLPAETLSNGPAIAARLVNLLPGEMVPVRATAQMPQWARIVMISGALAMSLAVNAILAPRLTAQPAAGIADSPTPVHTIMSKETPHAARGIGPQGL